MDFRDHAEVNWSLSARRAWIEIAHHTRVPGRYRRRSPQGERGLKSSSGHLINPKIVSLSARRAWIEIFSASNLRMVISSLSARRAWIEMDIYDVSGPNPGCRSPQGERGLKLREAGRRRRATSRSPQGERGLKYFVYQASLLHLRRSPQGERGLKFPTPYQLEGPGKRRSPQGERGLKFCGLLAHFAGICVALRKESVD